MNNKRRKEIEKLIERIESLKMDIEAIQEQEQEYIDNMPENLQDSERHENAETAVENLGCAYDSLQECIDYLQDVVDN